ncbi:MULTISPECIES: hypothetical protein [Rhizobium]|uniref:hypothetical protein n=1 Tax=Rhizobium TaxID=379 RepID=UPI000BBDF752|nr:MULTISPECIES: hypothetical protein [Rhizobium]PCK84488.1 hypothetical protein CPT32_23490 [Rhizobium sophoriradicis]PDS73619.1 hypothetical protein CO667_32160 [Rhizobium sp. L43]ULJ82502.1 hypothetical protein MF410_32135 [Rhizobium sp. C104]
MSKDQPTPETLLTSFAVDFRKDPVSLGRYCQRYPQNTHDFVALAHELLLLQSVEQDTPIDAATDRWIANLTPTGPSRTSPFAGLDRSAYAALRESLGVPGPVINAFRDRLITLGSVPLSFLEKFAAGLNVGIQELADYLSAPPSLSRGVQYKSDGKPGAASDKLSFKAVLEEANVSPEHVAELLLDED